MNGPVGFYKYDLGDTVCYVDRTGKPHRGFVVSPGGFYYDRKDYAFAYKLDEWVAFVINSDDVTGCRMILTEKTCIFPGS